MNFVGKTHVGSVRTQNEDSLYVSNNKIGFFDNIYIIADGMGGHNAGEVASQKAIEYFIEYIKESEAETEKMILEIILEGIAFSNKMVYLCSKTDDSMNGMGTTFTVATIKNGKVYVGHVGDSRLYLLDHETLVLISTDHTYVNEMLECGEITKEEARVHPKKNMITRALGVDDSVLVDQISFDIQVGDKLLLCSDGLTGMVLDSKIKKSMLEYSNMEELADKLIENALENGGLDNVSVIVGEILEVV